MPAKIRLSGDWKDHIKLNPNGNIVSSIDVKKEGPNSWRVYFDNGREPSRFMLEEWIELVQEMGSGEIVLTSIDREGTKKGFDQDLARFSSKRSSIFLSRLALTIK